jgi:hypothetical protein
MAEPSRRFPPPWHADPMPGGYVVRDANGQAVAYLYSRDNEDEARHAKVLTKEEARRIAVNIARLPELVRELVPGPALRRDKAGDARYGHSQIYGCRALIDDRMWQAGSEAKAPGPGEEPGAVWDCNRPRR